MIEASALRSGSLFALAEAGRLLADSLSLYRDQRYPSAVALAVFCREEIGRSTILAGLATKADAGNVVTEAAVRATCQNHERKLKQAYSGSSIRISGEEGVRIGAALRDRSRPQHADVRAAIDARVRADERQMPKQNHVLRMRSLYLDRAPDGSWSRPSEMTKAEAYSVLNQAAGDYAFYRDAVLIAEVVPEDVRLWRSSNELPPGDFPDD